jgi:hypothetical protein
MIRRVVAWVVAIASIGAYVVVPILAARQDGGFLLFGAATLTSVVVGLLLIERAPGNRVGPLLLLSGFVLASSFVLFAYAMHEAATATPHWPAVAIAAVVGNAIFIYPIGIALVGIPLIFPDGHLISPRWRWIVALTFFALAASTVQSLIAPDLPDAGSAEGELGIPALAGLADFLNGLGNVMSFICFGSAAAALWVRFHRGDRVERQQLKWLVAVAALAAIFFPLSFIAPDDLAVGDLFFALGVLALVAFPIVIAIAILRYHLFEIDRLISRTIAYLLITTVLVVAYVGLVILIGGPLADSRGGDTISVAVSTLVVAALFQPLRRRIQRIVDRRFDRARIDADRTTAAFSERLRDEVDIATLTIDLRDTVQAAIRPERLGIWLREAAR